VIRPEPILGSKLCSENRLLISDQLSMSASAISRQSKNAPGYWGVSQYQSRVRHEVGLNERVGCTQRFADYFWENEYDQVHVQVGPNSEPRLSGLF
jgi:hypothetical protein